MPQLIYYFAYGSNMNEEEMRYRCPFSVKLGRAELYDFTICMESNGYLNIRKTTDEVVYGILWQLTQSDLESLDTYEDVQNGLYERLIVSVSAPTEGRAEAYIYIARVTDKRSPFVRHDGYLERIIESASANGFPSEYIGKLLSFA